MSKTESPHHQLIAQWCAAFESKFGHKYVVQIKDTKAVKTLLASTKNSPEHLVDLAKQAWDMPESNRFWACNNQSQTLCGFGSSFNKIVVELSKVQTKRNDGGF